MSCKLAICHHRGPNSRGCKHPEEKREQIVMKSLPRLTNLASCASYPPSWTYNSWLKVIWRPLSMFTLVRPGERPAYPLSSITWNITCFLRFPVRFARCNDSPFQKLCSLILLFLFSFFPSSNISLKVVKRKIVCTFGPAIFMLNVQSVKYLITL